MTKRVIYRSAVACLLIVMAMIGQQVNRASGFEKAQIYRAALEHGRTASGISWSFSLKGTKHEGYGEVCAVLSATAPPQEPELGSEGEDAAECDQLQRPSDSIAPQIVMQVDSGSTAIEGFIYRPEVRKVVLRLSSGTVRRFKPLLPNIPRRKSRGIPVIRYSVVILEDDACIERSKTFDGRDRLVSSRKYADCPD